MTPDLDVATWLATQYGMVLGVDVFASPPIDGNGLISDDAVFVDSTGGAAPEESLGRSSSVWWPTVQIITRSKTRNGALDSARTMAYTATDHDPPTGYVSCDVLDSDPVLVEVDDKGRYYYSVNMRLTARRS